MSALLDRLVAVAADERENILPVTIELVAAGASMGDIVERLKGVWGTRTGETAGVLMACASSAMGRDLPPRLGRR